MVFQMIQETARPYNKRGENRLLEVRQGFCTLVLTPALLQETVQAGRVLGCAPSVQTRI